MIDIRHMEYLNTFKNFIQTISTAKPLFRYSSTLIIHSYPLVFIQYQEWPEKTVDGKITLNAYELKHINTTLQHYNNTTPQN